MIKLDRKNRKTYEEHDQDCIEEDFQLTSVYFDRDGVGESEAVGTVYCSINVSDGSELEIA